ncbi:MAG: FCD domain-containing protein [Lachnospiraceae bacterium]
MQKKQSAREVDEQHQRLVEAIIAGETVAAQSCMSEHMETIEKYMEEMQREKDEKLKN